MGACKSDGVPDLRLQLRRGGVCAPWVAEQRAGYVTVVLLLFYCCSTGFCDCSTIALMCNICPAMTLVKVTINGSLDRVYGTVPTVLLFRSVHTVAKVTGPW